MMDVNRRKSKDSHAPCRIRKGKRPSETGFGLCLLTKPLKRKRRRQEDTNMCVINAAPHDRARFRRAMFEPDDVPWVASERARDVLDRRKQSVVLVLSPA